MKTTILSEYGFHEALLGMGLSHGKTSGITSLWDIHNDASLKERALKLAGLGSGHDKFLRMIVFTLDITAPLYWWKQFDTYKVGTVAQSESTMHTLMKNPLTPEMFEGGLFPDLVRSLNVVGKQDGFETLNRCLPQSFLQRRIVQANYAVLANIIVQRTGHKLPEWKTFIESVLWGVQRPELLRKAAGISHETASA